MAILPFNLPSVAGENPGIDYDPYSMARMQENLLKIKKRQSKAKMLRGIQEKIGELNVPKTEGGYAPTVHGGLFQTVPVYAGPSKKQAFLEGLLGGAAKGFAGGVAGHFADKAEEDLAAEQLPAILGGVEQVGRMRKGEAPEGGPTEETMRTYLGLMGGPDIKDYLPKPTSEDKVRDTEVDEEGNIWQLYAGGKRENTHIKARAGMKPIVDANGNVYQVPTTTQGQAQAVTLEGQQPQGAQPPQAPSAPSAPQVLDREELHARQRQQESANNPNAVSSAGAHGLMQLMPETARALEQKYGYPPGSADSDPKVNESLGRLHMDDLLEKYKGNQADALIAYNRGEPNADAWIAAGRDPAKLPAETHGYLQKILGADPYGGPAPTAAAVSAPGNVPGQLNVGGARETEFLKAQGKAQADAQAALGKAEANGMSGIRAIDDLIGDPEGLGSIVGDPNAMVDWGQVPDALAQYGIPLLHSGGKQAVAFAKWQTVKSAAFLQAFEDLRGAGQITDTEGKKAEVAKAALSRSLPLAEAQKQLLVLREVIAAGMRRAKARAAGDFSGDNALSVTMPAGMTSPSVAPALQAPNRRAELRSKYGVP